MQDIYNDAFERIRYLGHMAAIASVRDGRRESRSQSVWASSSTVWASSAEGDGGSLGCLFLRFFRLRVGMNGAFSSCGVCADADADADTDALYAFMTQSSNKMTKKQTEDECEDR